MSTASTTTTFLFKPEQKKPASDDGPRRGQCSKPIDAIPGDDVGMSGRESSDFGFNCLSKKGANTLVK